MTAYGPILTSEPMSASGETMAAGWIIPEILSGETTVAQFFVERFRGEEMEFSQTLGAGVRALI
jgi:hypothetical protein